MPTIKPDGYWHWTAHVKNKMRFYGLSESRVKRIINYPERTEGGIAPKTVAVMQTSGSKAKPREVWAMFQKIRDKEQAGGDRNRSVIKVISAWRYPGRTKPTSPLPPEIMAEISEALSIK
jgi:hypothetical protein